MSHFIPMSPVSRRRWAPKLTGTKCCAFAVRVRFVSLADFALTATAVDTLMAILKRSMHGNGGYDGRLLVVGGDRRNKGKPFRPELLAPRSHVHTRVALRM